LLKDQTQKILETIEAQKSEKEALSAKRRRDLKTLEQNIVLEVNNQSESYFETGTQISNGFDDRAGGLRSEILLEKKERDNNTANLYSSISDEISLIQGELFAERKNREEAYDKIIKKLGLEVLRLNDTLNQEKKIREESHNQLRSMLVGMKTRLTSSLEAERRSRQSNQDFLFKLLEETVSKVAGEI